MSLLGSVLGLGTSALSGVLGGVGDVASSWATNSAKESLNKNVLKTNMKYQKQYDEWTQQQDKAYEQWWQQYLYDLQNNEYYNLARKYATNTASWAVEGLKKSGLNPILAGIDSNLSSSMGNAAPNQSGHSLGSRSVHGASVTGGHNITTGLNIAQAVQAHSAAELSETETKIKKRTAGDVVKTPALENAQISANTAKTTAEAQLISAQAEKTRADTQLSTVRTDNERRNAGNPNGYGALNRIGEALTDGDPLRRVLPEVVKRELTPMVNALVTGDFGSDHVATERHKEQVINLDPHKNYSDEELAFILDENGYDAFFESGFSEQQFWRADKWIDEHWWIKENGRRIYHPPKFDNTQWRLNSPRSMWRTR